MFSQTTEYALRAAVWLAGNEGSPQTNQKIATATQAPAAYLSKLMKSLARAGLVRGARGAGGGFELARPAASVSVLDVVNAVDPVCRIKVCPLGLASHKTRLCPLHKKLDEAIATIETSFRTTSLADVLGDNPRHRPLCDFVEGAVTVR